MKVLIAIDDSPYSKVVLQAACKRRWPKDTQFRLFTVVEPLPADCADFEDETMKTFAEIQQRRKAHLETLCSEARHLLEKAHPDTSVHYEVADGNAADAIVSSALQWEADRVLIGAHGHRVCPHNMPGSVSKKVATHAHCTVEVIQETAASLRG